MLDKIIHRWLRIPYALNVHIFSSGKTESNDFTYSWIRHILENMDAAGAVFTEGHASYSN